MQWPHPSWRGGASPVSWNAALQVLRCSHFGGEKIVSKFECVWWYYKPHKAIRSLSQEIPISVISAKFQCLCTFEELEQSNWVLTFTVYQMWHWWWAVWWCKGQSYICLRNLQAEFPALWVLRERKGGSSEENKCFLNFEFLCFDILPDFSVMWPVLLYKLCFISVTFCV